MRAALEVHLKNFSHNVQTLHSLQPKDSFFCPILKANGYGMGALPLARQLKKCGIRQVGVVSFEEALQLKDLAGDMEIYIFGPYHKNHLKIRDSYPFIPVPGNWENLKMLSQCKKPVTLHLKFNTGMNRFGFLPSEKHTVAEYIKKHPQLQLAGLASHLSTGEEAATREPNARAAGQINIFKELVQFFKQHFHPLHTHLLASAGGLSLWSHHNKIDPELGFRPGIGLYEKPGISFFKASAESRYHSINLKPVGTLKSFVVTVRHLPAGETVSYGSFYTTKRKSVVAVVSMGYADGLPYGLFPKGEVLFRGKRVPLAGPVCMDFFTIDITDAVKNKPVQTGEEVVIFGWQKPEQITLAELAKKTNSIPKVLLAQLGDRVQRVYKP